MAGKPIAIVAGVALACCGARALAQDTQGAQRVGLTANVQTVYDTNVARSSAALAAVRGLRPDDEIITPSATLDIDQPLGRGQFYFLGTAGYDFYVRNQILNSEDLNLNGGLRGRVAACETNLHGSYTRAQTQLQNLSLIVTRNVEDLSTIGADVTCGRPTGLAPTASISESWSGNSSAELAPSDYRSFSASAGVDYRRPRFGDLSLLGTYETSTYPNGNPLIRPSLGPMGYVMYGGQVRYTHKVGAAIDLVLNAGYTELVPSVPRLAGFAGPLYGLEATYHPTKRWQAHVVARRSVQPSDRPDTTYTIETLYSLDGSYRLSPHMQLSVGVSDDDSRFRGADLIPGFDLASQRIKAAFGDLNLKLGRRFNLTLDVREEDERADIAAFNYDDTRVGLTISARL